MAKRSPFQDRVHTLVFMFVITFVAMSLVSGLQVLTRNRVSVNQSLFLRRAVMEAAGLPVPKDKAEVLNWFSRCVEPVSPSNALPVFKITDPGRSTVTGYVVIGEGPGLWGKIRAAAGIDPRSGAFIRVTFLEQVETPGLGARIDEEWFRKQFQGKTAPLKLVPEGTRSPAPDEVDAITGATITSKAVQEILNGVSERAREWVRQPGG